MGVVKNFDQPDETRTFDRGRLDIVEVHGQRVGRAVFEPEWRWSESVRPIAGTDSCQVEHLVYVVSGKLGVSYDDGSLQEIRAGALAHLPAGHDAWTVGTTACVVLDFMGSPSYAVET